MLDLVESGGGLSLARQSVALGEAHAAGLVIADRVALSPVLSIMTLAKRAGAPMLASVLDLLEPVWSD